jgi:hypothetical protein
MGIEFQIRERKRRQIDVEVVRQGRLNKEKVLERTNSTKEI